MSGSHKEVMDALKHVRKGFKYSRKIFKNVRRVSNMIDEVLNFTGMVQNREEESQIGPYGVKVIRKNFNFVSKGIN